MDSSTSLLPLHATPSAYGSAPRIRSDLHPLSNVPNPPPQRYRSQVIHRPPFSEYHSSKTSQFNLHRFGLSEGLSGYSSSLNILLIFVPLGLLSALLDMGALPVFLLNFCGMIPLAMLLGKATEDIASHTSETIGALINVTFGNAVEIILCLSALRAGRIALIRDTIAGSVLSNLLLVLGSALFFGGLVFREQVVLPAVSEANSDLLSFAVFGFSVPAVFALSLKDGQGKLHTEELMSLATSICLLIIYFMYLYFQLVTHAELYRPAALDIDLEASIDLEAGPVDTVPVDEEEPKPASLPLAMAILIATVVFVAVSSELLVATIDGFSKYVGLGEKFIAVIILPVVGNAVEHMSAILVARHDKIDLSIGIACGSSVQIALFAAPVLVVISWLMGDQHLTLNFELLETICIVFSVFVVNATLRDSRTNWLEGAVLVMCYIIIGSAFFYMG